MNDFKEKLKVSSKDKYKNMSILEKASLISSERRKELEEHAKKERERRGESILIAASRKRHKSDEDIER